MVLRIQIIIVCPPSVNFILTSSISGLQTSISAQLTVKSNQMDRISGFENLNNEFAQLNSSLTHTYTQTTDLLRLEEIAL